MKTRRPGSMRDVFAVAALAAFLTLGCGESPSPSSTFAEVPSIPTVPAASAPAVVVDTGPLPEGRLAFDYEASGSNSRIYTMRFDGSELRALGPVGDDAWAYAPAWSPDGTRIAYWGGDGAGVDGVFVVRADGSATTLVASGGHSPFWLDDARVGYSCPIGLCVAAAGGSQRATLLARTVDDEHADQWYRPSPDGRMLAFTRTTFYAGTDYALTKVYLMKLDGSGERRLVISGLGVGWDDADASWAPDGGRLAFRSSLYGIAVATVDGREVHGVAGLERSSGITGGMGVAAPAWSPDGTRILFGSDPREFYVANADGAGTIRRVRVPLPSSGVSGRRLTWSWTSP